MLSLQERGKLLYAKGYRYCVECDAFGQPLFFKSPGEVGPFMRANYPNEKNYRGYPIDEHGNEIK